VAPPRTLSVLAAAAALVLAGTASAKELTRVAICGRADVCATISDPDRLRLVPMGGATSVGAPPLQPFYWMRLTISEGGGGGPGAWLAAPVLLGIAGLALLLRRLPPHQARDQLA
jgi:hypothetical protein